MKCFEYNSITNNDKYKYRDKNTINKLIGGHLVCYFMRCLSDNHHSVDVTRMSCFGLFAMRSRGILSICQKKH